MKPVASGSDKMDGVLVNQDVQSLKRHVNVDLPDKVINPYIFEDPISPHFAAAKSGVAIDPARISRAFNLCTEAADIVIVEGAGGWRVPLVGDFYISSLVQKLNIPVVLVSGLKLGCINHTLLTAQAIQNDGIELLAWAANSIDPGYRNKAETIELLRNGIKAPLIAEIDWQSGADPLLAAQAGGPSGPEIAAAGVDMSIFGLFEDTTGSR